MSSQVSAQKYLLPLMHKFFTDPQSRVVLQSMGDELSTYINANYIRVSLYTNYIFYKITFAI